MGFALSGNETTDYCREIETYLCQKNEGHLIRIAGPAFELVSGWAAQGVPLKVAFSGIDRYVERYDRKGPLGPGARTGPRRRPIRIDFCDADVLDAFDEWRRAIGLPATPDDAAAGEGTAGRSSPSLPAHLERVAARLTAARVNGKIDGAFDALIDGVARELDAARGSSRGALGGRGVRGDARLALVARLATLDGDLVRTARAALDEGSRSALVGEADAELASYRDRMAPDAFARARDAALDRLVREYFGLPTVTFR